MSERGQKVFKIITWVVIGALFIVYMFRLASFVNNPDSFWDREKITRIEWMTKLADGFGDSSLLSSVSDAENITTGEYAAITSMDAIGENRLSYLTDEELTDDKKIELAIETGIITKKQVNEEITVAEADAIIVNALNVYCDPNYYPDYFQPETKVDVVDADNWRVDSYDESSHVMTASIDDKIPETGEIIMYTDKYGMAQARRVDDINEVDDEKYELQLSKVEDASEIFDSISFSGSGDFSYLTGNDSSSSSEEDTRESAFQDPFAITAHAAETEPLMVAEWEWFEDKTAVKKENSGEDTQKCDIECNAIISDTEKNGKDSASISSDISIKSNGITKKYTFEKDEQGKVSFKESLSSDDGLSFEFSKNDKKNKSLDTSYLKDDMSVVANVKLTNFSVSTSGYYQWADPNDSKNYVEVVASAETVSLSTTASLSSEDKYKIGTLPIPIASTAGVISVNLNIYLVVSASGELTLWQEIDDPYIGLNVSVANGVKPLHGCSNEDVGVRAKAELSGGLIGEAAVKVLDTVDLADPGVDARVYASASTVDVKDLYKLKKKYEGTHCTELKIQWPVVKLTATAGEDSLLYALLDTLNVKATYDLIKKDSDNRLLQKLTYHVEQEPDGTVNVIKLEGSKTHEDVCTHIEKKTKAELDAEGIKEDIENEIDNKVDEAEKDAKKKIQQMIEDAIQQWLLETCEDCESCVCCF